MTDKITATVPRLILREAARLTAERLEAEAKTKREAEITRLAQKKHWLTRRPLGHDRAKRRYHSNANYFHGGREAYWAAHVRRVEQIADTSHLNDIRLSEPMLDVLRPALNEPQESNA